MTFGALALSTLCVPSARAADEPPVTSEAQASAEEMEDEQRRQRAIEADARGSELYSAGKFAEALTAFEEAATLYASPEFQFNIARCYERLGAFEQAIHHYDLYLRTAEDPPDRAVIEDSIADLERRLADEARAEAKPAPEPVPAPLPIEPTDPPGRGLSIAGASVLGIGAALGLGGGLGYGLHLNRDNRSVQAVLEGNPSGLTFAETEQLAARARRSRTISLALAGAGGALALTGAALLAVGMRRRAAARTRTSARLHLVPSGSPEGVGLILSGQF